MDIVCVRKEIPMILWLKVYDKSGCEWEDNYLREAKRKYKKDISCYGGGVDIWPTCKKLRYVFSTKQGT